MKKLFTVFLVWLICSPALAAHDTLVIKRLSGIISFKLFTTNGQLAFLIASGNNSVIENSNLNIVLDGRLLTSQVSITKVSNYSINEKYDWFGAHSPAVNNCTGRKITINGPGAMVTLDVRVFDDGAAFRTIIPITGRGALVAHVPDESTCFKLPPQSDIWYHDMY